MELTLAESCTRVVVAMIKWLLMLGFGLFRQSTHSRRVWLLFWLWSATKPNRKFLKWKTKEIILFLKVKLNLNIYIFHSATWTYFFPATHTSNGLSRCFGLIGWWITLSSFEPILTIWTLYDRKRRLVRWAVELWLAILSRWIVDGFRASWVSIERLTILWRPSVIVISWLTFFILPLYAWCTAVDWPKT